MNVFFTGSGGTGKTTVLPIVADMLGLPIMTSVVRGFTASRGYASQIVVNALPVKDRVQFQLDLMVHYVAEVERFAAGHPDGMIMDRSVYCHAGYALLSDLSSTWSVIDQFIPLFERFERLRPVLVYFQYPPPWLDYGVEDQFRDVRPAHDYLLDAVIWKWLQGRFSPMTLNRISARFGDPLTRSQWIVSHLKGL